jgi:hypothetical protein
MEISLAKIGSLYPNIRKNRGFTNIKLGVLYPKIGILPINMGRIGLLGCLAPM